MQPVAGDPPVDILHGCHVDDAERCGVTGESGLANHDALAAMQLLPKGTCARPYMLGDKTCLTC